MPHLQMSDVAPAGFNGAVTGLVLADVIQLKIQNRFCGCISVAHINTSGKIFFRDGEIIHAEMGDITGAEAFYQILSWPGGTFILDPKIATTLRTINDDWQFLLLEAHRLMDEKRRKSGRAEPQTTATPPIPAAAPTSVTGGIMASIFERLKQIPGVMHSVVLNKDGVPVSDDSYASEKLAAQAQYLIMVGNMLGEPFSAGDVKSAAVEGVENHLLLFESRQLYLSIVLAGSSNIAAAENDIRKVLMAK